MSTVLIIGGLTFLSTLLGGLFALHLRDRLHLILGFSAGAILGLAFFDLLPEAFELAGGHYGLPTISSMVALGFAIYMLLDRLVLLHTHAEEEAGPAIIHRGNLGAASLSFHSLLDGLGIGLAFHVSAAVGVVVAVAVLTHDFSDGINTVNLVLKNGGGRVQAGRWLLIDCLAPVLGVLATFFLQIPGAGLGLLLAVFAGFLLYIGASDLLPESHHAHPVRYTTLSTIFGMALLYLVIHLATI